MVNLLIGLLVALIFFCLLMLILRRKNLEEKNINNRMAYFAGVEASLRYARASGSQRHAQKNLRGRLYTAVKSLGARLGKIKKSSNFDRKMQQAGWPLLGSEFQVVLLGCGAVGALVLGILTMTPVNALLGFVAGCLVCLMVLSISIQRRQKAFINQLGDMLTMIANALRAGFSFMQALDHIASEMDDPVKGEVKRVVMDVNVGLPLEEALNNMTERIDSPDFNLVVAAVLIQRQVGGNLAQILDTISETINERVRMRREISALTAQGRLSGMILGLLPFGIAAIIQLIAPGYLDPLITTKIGKIALAGAGVMMIMGFVVIRSIIDIKM